MTRLIVVSNRLGDPSKPASGGLAVALNGALNAMGGIWAGWSGEISDGVGGGPARTTQAGKVTLAGIDLTQAQYEGYYLGYSNSTLWPAFHHRLDLVDNDTAAFDQYCAVNRLFASHVAAMARPDDIIWVHDYHLLPLAHELRAMGVKNRIGFFLHIPFPPSQTISAIPGSEWWMRAMFAYDVLGFQTKADVMNFRLYTQRQLNEPVDHAIDTVTGFGRSVMVKAYPIGIDVDQFRALLDEPEALELRKRLEQKSSGRQWITGVERLDYSKGLPERMKIFRRLLQKYPANQGNATLVQIAPPTREGVEAYSDIREQLELLSGSVNGEFATIDWTPVRYIHRHVMRARLAALFSISRVGMVTPLRDGMNLVAKEYVAVQPDDDPGVLVLSEFAGAAEEMTEAILVNPYNIEGTADALQRALSMDLEERRERHLALKAKVEAGDVVTWCREVLNDLQSV
ncbi:trehalose-6-phosphate synthase [Rhizobiaceae bacterium]|nr:trehalose-6-phosphate synthase [Rhizobiaceae bacterium]